MTRNMRVLVTGGSGQLGRVFASLSGDTYHLRLTYNANRFEAPGHEVLRMDLTDYASVLGAMQGMEAVVHLGADSASPGTWESVLPNNIVGTYNAYEAAREAGVNRFVYASSNHATGYGLSEAGVIGPDAPIRPTGIYGVSKCFGEALGRYYNDRYGMQVICLRIGTCHGGETIAGQRAYLQRTVELGGFHPYTLRESLSMWLSSADMVQLIHKSLETDCPFGIFYGISANTPAAFDLSETRRVLGYAPVDNVQDLFDRPIDLLGR